jgi:hypothetical protein
MRNYILYFIQVDKKITTNQSKIMNTINSITEFAGNITILMTSINILILLLYIRAIYCCYRLTCIHFNVCKVLYTLLFSVQYWYIVMVRIIVIVKYKSLVLRILTNMLIYIKTTCSVWSSVEQCSHIYNTLV